ncbi:Hypothetical protein A7982_10534 [Minicystis rosea]|nr:Hypothetical protein A7982_10534 [Minicystis rosea]
MEGRAGIAMRRIYLCTSVLLGVLAVGCNDPANDLDEDGLHRPDPLPIPTAAATYPDGPFDVSKGAVVPNYNFPGFVNAKVDSATMQTIALGDFYNPHGDDPSYEPASPEKDDRLFPEGSPYGAGNKKPLVLVIAIGSVWCGPCNEEAKNLLPTLYAKYKPCGGEILYQLVEGASPGIEATQQNLKTWTKVYKVDYPISIDPGRQLSALYPTASFPDAAVIDTRTMRMIEVIQGVPDDAFWAVYESRLVPGCLAKP